MRSKFLDKLFIHVKAGSGGNGFPKLRGVGGKGGDVWVATKDNQTLRKTKLSNPSQRFVAGVGQHSKKFKIQGDPGPDHIIHVPSGVQVITKEGRVLGDCNAVGDRVLAARGGAGGGPTNNYLGQPGEIRQLYLTLKLIADVGLVGFPNAGKSTLLRALSRATPKIASYPFTTMSPELGVVHYPDLRQINVADLPGLVEGASRNVGLGHSFLRHVERTKLLLFVVDVNGFQLSQDRVSRSALETVAILNREIELYNPELLDKPAILAVNKMDTPGSAEVWRQLRDQLTAPAPSRQLGDHCRPQRWVTFDHLVPLSAKTDAQSVEHLKRKLRASLDLHHAPAPPLPQVLERIARTGAGPVIFKERVVDMDGDGWRRRRPDAQPAPPQLS